jgi:hypothetical protein
MKIFLKTLLCFVLFWGLSGCNKFLDVNTDPNSPTEPVLDLLLPSTQVSMANHLGAGNPNIASTVIVQHATQGGFSRFELLGTSFQTAWNGLYASTLSDLDILVRTAEARRNGAYSGMGKLLKAYTYSVLVDLFGDIPYSEALQGEANVTPRFDEGASVYRDLFRLIDEGVADLQRNPYVSPGNVDLIYRGDRALWIRMANSLKLKMLLQMRLIPAERERVTREISQLIAGGQLISTNAQDFTFRFGTAETPMNRHPTYLTEYRAAKNFYMDQGFMDRLLNADDPRLRYYIYRQRPDTGVSFTLTSNGYGGRFTGDPTGIPADNAARATFGLYPYGGLYDNNPIRNLPATNRFISNTGTNSPAAHRIVATSDGSGAGWFPMITNFMVQFMLAEASLTLGTTGDARTYLRNAITAQLQGINSFVAAPGNSGVALPADVITAFVDSRLAQFDAATDARGRLNVIMTEKYIALFGNGFESYNDYRRTGLPQLMTPIAPLNPFPQRFTIALREITTNPNAPQVNDITRKVFWDID